MARCPTCHRRLVSGQTCATHGVVDGGASRTRSDIAATPAWSQPLTEYIGSGGFAAVWASGSGGVVKVAHADHELARARMRREAEALAAIGAPAVPACRGTGVLADGRAWIEMDRVLGTNLGDVIAAGPIGVVRVFAIAEGILAALARVHAAGFAHRDVKPDNLVEAADGSIVLLDLGLARKLPDDPDDPTRAGIQVGSLEYIAPEQLVDAAAAREPADIYAFGCVLYELCAGRPPFLGDAATLERAHAALRPTPLGALADVPAELATLCLECLAKQPARRPAVAEAARRLRTARAEPSVHRTQQSRSVIREGKQPVVLLWVELPRVDRALLGMLAARKVTIISQRGRRVLGGITGADHPDPATAAIAVARDLAAAGARAALHLEPLRVGVSASGMTLAGEAVDHPETWLPGGAWTGVVVTGAIAGVARVRTRSTDLGTGFLRLGEPGELTELFGRDAVLDDLTADAAAALAGAGPGLSLLLGEPGVGKTEVARALAAPLRELGAHALVATIPPPGSGRPSESALAPILGVPGDGPVVRVIGDALRAAARARPTAIVLDDLHLATHELLDALEYATLGGESLRLWILGVAPTRFEQRRSGFGARAEHHRRTVLPPLDGDAAVALTAALLHPAEYPPLRALRQISAIANGNPMHLVTLAREIRERGAIRARPSGEFFLDTTGLETLPTIALGPWLAARELSGLPAELAALTRLCAVLGDEVARDEIAAVVDRVERAGGATTTIDVDVGLAELVHAGLLVAAHGRWSFHRALVKEGVYATTNEAERTALHAAALAFWRARDVGAQDPSRLARHAEAVGARDVAADAFAVLGSRAHAEHRELDADQAWEGALRNLDDGDPRLPHALLGRARARYRSQRRIEALADIERVVELAAQTGEVALEVEALLEQATVFDWTGSFEQSRASAERARARWSALPEPSTVQTLGAQLAEARSLYRFQQLDEATIALSAVAAAARDLPALEIEIVARLLLGLVLVDTAALDAAERELAAALALCERHGDRFHLAVGYTNRARLWSAHGLVERGAEDMRQVIQLAREGGQAQIERVAAYNMAEDLLWQGALDEALRLARRSLALQLGQGEGSAAVDRVLVARILAARQDRTALAEALVAITSDERLSDELAVEMNGAEHAILSTLRAVAGSSGSEIWSTVLSATGSLPPSLQIEVGLLAAAAGQLREPLRTQLVELAKADPIFAGRLAEL